MYSLRSVDRGHYIGGLTKCGLATLVSDGRPRGSFQRIIAQTPNRIYAGNERGTLNVYSPHTKQNTNTESVYVTLCKRKL